MMIVEANAISRCLMTPRFVNRLRDSSSHARTGSERMKREKCPNRGAARYLYARARPRALTEGEIVCEVMKGGFPFSPVN